jgi:hypothetical protein
MARIRTDILVDAHGDLGVSPRFKGRQTCLLKINGQHDLKAARELNIKLVWTTVFLPGKPTGKAKKINAFITKLLKFFPSLQRFGLRPPGNTQSFWTHQGSFNDLERLVMKVNQRACQIILEENGGKLPPKTDRYQFEQYHC